MAIAHYLAMTPAELMGVRPLPPKIAWLSCRFSPWGHGLSNLPQGLPPGQLLILDDAVPMSGHRPEVILGQMEQAVRECRCAGVLLDFQREPTGEAQTLARVLVEGLDCPVGVPQSHAGGLDCPVFLSPVPPDTAPEEWLAPWQGRELWLDGAANALRLLVREGGTEATALSAFAAPEGSFRDEALHCHYCHRLSPGQAEFTVFRTAEDVKALLSHVQTLGVTTAVSLWQELAGGQNDVQTPTGSF